MSITYILLNLMERHNHYTYLNSNYYVDFTWQLDVSGALNSHFQQSQIPHTLFSTMENVYVN